MSQQQKYSKKFKRKCVKAWLKSKLTKSAFCTKWGVSPRSIGRWYSEDASSTKKEKPTTMKKVIDKAPLQFVITETSAIIYKGAEKVVINSDNPLYKHVIESLVDSNWEDAWKNATVENILKFSGGDLKVVGDKVTYGSSVVSDGMTEKLLKYVMSGSEEANILALFMSSLYRNTDARIVTELYEFLKHNSIELCEDGSFIAYKGVNSDYTDKYTGTIDNSVGQKPCMLASEVNPDKEQTCSYGYHTGSLEYAKSFAGQDGRIMRCKVFPHHVVSVPTDYNGQKLRCFTYEVIEEI